jgi:hypothetical protein
MPYRQARVGENEALFREVNETVAAAAESVGTADPIDFLCECGQGWCAEGIFLTREEYEQVRAHAHQFLIKPDHNRPAIEHVIERYGRYWVVEKFGEAAETADETDPRSQNGKPSA